MTPIFKGLTRPPMIFGVPIVPLFAGLSVVVLLAFYTQNLFIAILALPVYFIQKIMAKKDAFIFRLYFLQMRFFTNPLSKKFHGVKTFSSNSYDRNIIPNAYVPKLSITALHNEPNFKKLIPFSSIIDDGVIITRDYLLISTYQIHGISFECESDSDLAFKNDALNMCFKSFANEPISFYFHNVRHEITDSLDASFKNSYLQDIDEKYKQSFGNGALFKNSLFLTIIYAPITRLEKTTFSKSSFESKRTKIKGYLQNFKEYRLRLESNLKSFEAKLLSTYEKDSVLYSKQLEFYNFLLGGRFQPVRALNMHIYEYLSGSLNSIYFSHDTAQLNYNDEQKRFFRIVEIKDYASHTFAGILDSLMYLNISYTITQSYEPLANIDAKTALKKQQKQLRATEDDSYSQIEELDLALDNLASGEIGFGKYHFEITIFGDSLQECKNNTNEVITHLNELGFMANIASIALPSAYFSCLPCNFNIRPRINLLSTHNFSSLIALHNFDIGKRDRNCWGDAVCILKTPNKSPYYLSFHQSNKNKDDFGELLLANSLILGQSGGGKTVFMNFTFNQMQKYANPNSFPESTPPQKRKFTAIYLDKDKGALGNILCAGGRYISIENGKSTGFNPFMVEATQENLRALKSLMTLLVTRKGEELNA